MFTKHNNKTRSNQFKPRCYHPHFESAPNVRCYHPPLAGGSKLQGNFGEGSIKNFINSNTQLNPNSFTPSQNFLAENFTLPQGEGDNSELKKSDCTELKKSDCTELKKSDCTELDNGDCKELLENSKINFKVTQLKKLLKILSPKLT